MASKSTSLYGWCFLLAGMSSASGASLPFYFWGGQVIFSFIASSYAYDTGEWSFLQGTQAYQLSITHKSAPCAWEGDMRKCSLPIPFYSAV